MKTIEDFFDDVESLTDYLEARGTKTIHTDEYEENVRELYADWQQVKISLEPIVDKETITDLDDEFSILLDESRKSNSSISSSLSHLSTIEDEYVEHVYPEISHREIQAGFVNGLVSDLEQLKEDKYHEYMQESIQCVQAGAYRGAVVLGWQAAIYGLYQKLEESGEPIHVSYEKKFGSTPEFRIEDFWDFQKIQDEHILLIAEDTGLIDKSLKDMLSREKDIRNKAAHPGIYDVGPNGTKALLETVMQLLVELDF